MRIVWLKSMPQCSVFVKAAIFHSSFLKFRVCKCCYSVWPDSTYFSISNFDLTHNFHFSRLCNISFDFLVQKLSFFQSFDVNWKFLEMQNNCLKCECVLRFLQPHWQTIHFCQTIASHLLFNLLKVGLLQQHSYSTTCLLALGAWQQVVGVVQLKLFTV